GLVYAGNLLQGQLLWEAGNIPGAREMLDACRWDYRGFEHAVLRRQFNQTCATLRGPQRAVHAVAFSRDGRHVAGAGSEGTASVWDAHTGVVAFTLRGHTGGLHGVAFSPDDRRIVTGGEDRLVKIWDAADGRELLTLRGHRGQVNGVTFSPDGR